MKFAVGNSKLGKRVYVVSRPVGDSCSDHCYYLHNGCYAEATENRFKNARIAAFDNMKILKAGVWNMVRSALDTNHRIRIHERGDFLMTNSKGHKQVDKKYLRAWTLALKEFSLDEIKSIGIWYYTHSFDCPEILELENYGVSCYASINDDNAEEDYATAYKTGYRLFAFCTKYRKKKGGSNDFPKYYDHPIGGRTLVCPEQRIGRKRVTCCGTKNTTACNWCVYGKGNVVFLEH